MPEFTDVFFSPWCYQGCNSPAPGRICRCRQNIEIVSVGILHLQGDPVRFLDASARSTIPERRLADVSGNPLWTVHGKLEGNHGE